MFDTTALAACWRAYATAPPTRLEVVKFGQDHFTHPESEETIWAVRASKADAGSGMQFWVQALVVLGRLDSDFYSTAYVESALCEPVWEAEFARVVAEHSHDLVPPLPGFVRDLTGWRAGLRMYAEWNDVAVVAELADSFVLFAWDTSA